MLILKNITKIYNSKFILKDINFELKKNDSLAIIGENGSGKTTLIKLICNLITPSSGDIFLEKNNILKINKKEFRKKIQISYQNPYSSINPLMKIKDILKEPLIIHKKHDKKEHDKIISKILDLIEMPNNYKNYYPYQLSGGQRQKISIAKSLILNPSIVIFDEPFSSLDIISQEKIINLIKKVQLEKKLTYIIITHDISTVKLISNNILILKEGKIIEKGLTSNLLKSPKNAYTKKLIHYSLL